MKKFKWVAFVQQGGFAREFNGEVEQKSWAEAMNAVCESIEANWHITGEIKNIRVTKV